jgi:hypothetical protein
MEMNVHSSLSYELVRDEILNIILNELKYLINTYVTLTGRFVFLKIRDSMFMDSITN